MSLFGKNKTGKAPRPSMAESSDKQVLYQQSVQMPEIEVEFFTTTFQELRGKFPLVLKEDFCGTALLSTAWCQSNPHRTAVAVDICADTLQWGREHNLHPAGEDVAKRVQLIHADVRAVTDPKVDITCAFNFSYWVFKTRDAMREYFKQARAGIKPDGLFFLDIFGGTDCQDILEEETEMEDHDFTYVWEHAEFNPINHDLLCHIHYEFPDGSRIEKAFTYDWRLWSIPELHELLLEAGFSKVHVYWERFVEREDDSEYLEGTGEFFKASKEENQESWQAYVIAEV
ncbi:MAG: class I SAM-dependent methyltransferase [Gammaproteobacteria bacterium]|nr:class I SAM-dependent methyltransferase [Gammaproteobacteria bacterium]